MSHPPVGRFERLHEEQSALVAAIAYNGFVDQGILEREVRVAYTDEAVKSFCELFEHFLTQQRSSREVFRDKVTKAQTTAKRFAAKVTGFKDNQLIDDVSYFCIDLGASAAGTSDVRLTAYYSDLPRYYPKIERRLIDKKQLQPEWTILKAQTDEVVALHAATINVHIDVSRSIGAIKSLFLHDIPVAHEFFYANDFFSPPSEFVTFPMEANTKAEVGEKAVEILEKCAEEILASNSKNKNANTLAESVRGFAAALNKKGWQKKFAALSHSA